MKKSITLLNILLAFFLIAKTPVFVSAQSIPDENMVFYFPFSGNADDMSGNGNNGTVYGATLTEDRFGIPNSAYSFHHEEENYIELSFMIPNMTEVTLCAWVKFTGGGNKGTIFCDATEEIGNDYLMNMTMKSIGIRADKGDAKLNYENGALFDLNLGDTWHHIAWVLTPEQSSIYLDGLLKLTIDTSGNNVDFHNLHPSIGRRHVWNYGDYYFDGKIDELRMYDKELDENEIMSIYNFESAVEYIESGLNAVCLVPNPASRFVEILNLPEEKFNVEIFDMNGRCLSSQTNKNLIDVTAYPKGLYFVKISLVSGNSFRTLKLSRN